MENCGHRVSAGVPGSRWRPLSETGLRASVLRASTKGVWFRRIGHCEHAGKVLWHTNEI
jgi:hypothetical protein